MIQDNLVTSNNFGRSQNQTSFSSEGMQELEIAGRQVDKQLTCDSYFPFLLDQFKLPPQGGASISGLNENDYPVGLDSRHMRHLHTLRKVPLPSDLVHHFQHMQCNCMMGLFPEIKRAWLTIDSDIYVWMYEDGSDLAYFDGLHEAILSVNLVSPKPGVFKPYIEYLLCLATPTEIILLGVSFTNPEQNEGSSSVHLLPEPLFTVSLDGAYILTIKGTKSGRIFLGAKDGSLWELVYQAEFGWFSRKCYKVNHSRSSLSYILPSFLTLSEDDPVIQIEVDDSRHIVYTLTERGNITVFDLGADGTSTSKVLSLNHSSISNSAIQVARTIDKVNFKNLVAICAVDKSESPHVHVVIVTGTGVRLYYAATPLSTPGGRPSQLSLLHIRLPPGFAANALTHRPTKVHKALYSHGIGILCASESEDADVIWTVSRDQFPYQPSLAESQAVVAVDGYVWALADVSQPLWCSALSPPTLQGTVPPLLVTQHQQQPRELVLLSASGTHILTALRPVDQLRHLLRECRGADAPAVREFFASVSPTQACAMALILATDPNVNDVQVTEWATDALFRFGSANLPALSSSLPQPNLTYSFLPTQVSTPLPGQQMTHLMQSPNPQQSTTLPQVQSTTEQQFSPIHDSLYLFLSRIVRPVWAMPLVKEQTQDGQSSLISVFSLEEVSFLARHVDLLSKFMQTHQGPGQQILETSLQRLQRRDLDGSTGLSSLVNSGNLSEKTSLLALRSLLSHCLEVLRLWTVLLAHNFTLIAQNLPKDTVGRLRTVGLRDLVLNGTDICRHLILALMDRYHGDNSSIDTISMRLREVCPSLHRTEDAALSKANEIILAAKNKTNKTEREQAFREAVKLCKQIGHSVNVAGICAQLASGGWFEGVVDLCLSVASQRDPNDQGLHYYKHNESSDDSQGLVAFTARMECYRTIVHHISQLVDSSTAASPPLSPSKIPFRPGPPSASQQGLPSSEVASQFAEMMINFVIESSDELAHVTLYEWLVETDHIDRLLNISSPFLENFLTKSEASRGLFSDLLWRYYQRNKQYHKAAKILAQLADQPGELALSARIEHLSRALMCLSSSQMTTTHSNADFILHLEEKKDVARVQLMVLEAIEAKGGGSDVINSLNSALLDITTLYEKYAEPWDLWECKLAIVHCAGHSEPQLIATLWTNIIESELNSNRHQSSSLQIDSLAAKIKNLARTYSLSPSFFPLEHIVKSCELKSVQLMAEDSTWVANALAQGCGVPLSKLIAVYHRLYTNKDGVWEVERTPFHLLRVIAHLFSLVTESPSAPTQERRALKEECLDFVASYLTDLGSSVHPSAVTIASQLRACQMRLEGN